VDYQKFTNDLIANFTGQANVLVIPKPLADFMGSLEGGLLLSQILYWSGRVNKESEGWFYKSYRDWEEELGLSKYKVSSYTKKMKEIGFLDTKVKKANGDPTVHYRLKIGEFQKTFGKFLHDRSLKNLTNGSEEISQTLTETTTETTTETNNNAHAAKFDEPKPARKPTPKPPFDPVQSMVAAGVDPDAAADYVELRRAKRAPLTARALKLLSAEAAKAKKTLADVIDICVMNGWQSYKAEWDTQQRKRSGGGGRTINELREMDVNDLTWSESNRLALSEFQPDPTEDIPF